MCTQQANRFMKAQDLMGSIIVNGSLAAHAPRPVSVACTSTKHAVTRATARIRV
jgi:NADP-dependent 3-hydroxy acid dehydrogenase YdfG